MKRKTWLGVLLAVSVTAAACGGGGSDPDAQLARVAKMLKQDWVMSDDEKSSIDTKVSEAKALLAAGQKEAASELLAKAVAELEVIGDRDRLNKAE